ncbi:hypothetical protein ACFYP0_19055 [Micromonospora arida]|uniref:hypothetical protein n=1 Tax=Micromonospora arida TaxID=2203715 RepID=UPI0033A5B07D
MLHKTGTLLTAALLGLTATIGGAGPAAAAPSASADAPTFSLSRPTDPADESTPITVELATHYWNEIVPDVDPSDNTVTFNLALSTS